MAHTDIEIPRRGTFLRKLWALTWPYFKSEERWVARGLLAVIIAMSLGLVFMNVLFNYWYKDFYDALQNKDEAAFWHQIVRFVYLAAIYIVLRIAHAALYIGDYATPRSIVFGVAWLVNIAIFVLPLFGSS